jgi:hypothetical protein
MDSLAVITDGFDRTGREGFFAEGALFFALGLLENV